MSDVLEAAARGWSWKIGRPVHLIAQNAFGNVIIENDCGLYWRIIPEDVKSVLLADSLEELEIERAKKEFKLDWNMEVLVEKAEAALGPLAQGECYHLVIPGPLGGEYNISNIKKISAAELLDFTGFVAKKIEGLPDGTKIKFDWI